MFKKTKLLIVAIIFLLGIQSTYAVFSDVASDHPNYEAIMYLQENDIIEGYSDHTFRPYQLVNRAEALKIILLGSDILVPEIQEQDIFPDVMYESWYAKYVSKAKNLSIVSGDSDTGIFRPGDTVNLAEALKILLKTNQIDPDFPDSNPHPDVPHDAWFAPYFGYAEEISLLDQTSNENVNPATPINRGLLAELMYRLSQKPSGYTEGEASYYGEAFHGKTTASGEVFDASGFTAAHRTFPFNTWLLVTNLENGESIKVRVNDRGPYAGDRIIDLSKAAFESISPLSRGVIDVSIQPTTAPSKEESEDSLDLGASLLDAGVCTTEKNNLRYISKNSYDNITLDKELSNRIIEGEVLILSGSTSNGSASTVSAFIVDENDKQISFYGPIQNQTFEFNVHFPSTGTFKLGILPGESGSSIVHEIKVLSPDCLKENENVLNPSPLSFTVNRDNGDTLLKWQKGGYRLFKIKFTQGNNSVSYFLYDTDEFRPYYPDFEDFEEGLAEVSIQGADVAMKSMLEPYEIMWSSTAMTSFNAVTHYEYKVEDDTEILDKPESISPDKTFKIKVQSDTSLMKDAAVILPNGDVEKIELTSSAQQAIENANGVEIFTPSPDELTLSYKPTDTGVYFAEINNANGLAAINIPLYPQDKYPLLPNPIELYDFETESFGSNIGVVRNKMLELVNNDRYEHEKNSLVIDSSLNQLAQFRADDMAQNGYFSHWDEQGRSANDLKKNFAINQIVAENIAKDVDMELAEYGLMRSALHRSNILFDEWIRVGFGIAEVNDGSYLFVQIFSADPINLEDTANLRQEVLDALNENRSINLSLQSNLNDLAQIWSEKMVNEDFFDFTAPDGSTLVNNIRDADVNATLGTYLIGNTSFYDGVEQIAENAQLLESQWANLGVGIKQDSLGIIKITLIYTE